LPGGHVHVGESSKDSIIREFKEEVNVTCNDIKLISITENFFLNKEKKKVHEICYFYLVDTNDEIEVKDYSCVENDEGIMKNLEFKWIDLNALKDANFRPNILINKLMKKNYEFEHIIYDNEIKK